MKCLWKLTSKTLRPSLHDPHHHPPAPLPVDRWLRRWSLPTAQHHLLCSQTDFMKNSKTNTFPLQLERQDKQGAKLGANCNTTDFGSQPSFQLLIYFCPKFPASSPSLQYFWAYHNTHCRATNGCVAKCLSLTNQGISMLSLLPLFPPLLHHRQGWETCCCCFKP